MNRRGRPKGSTGQAAVLGDGDVRRVFKVARSRDRFPERAEAVLALSLGLGLRAGEIARLRWGDVYARDGRLQPAIRVDVGGRRSDVALTSRVAREVLAAYAEKSAHGVPQPPEAPLLPCQKGGHLTAGSLARYLKGLYLEAGLAGGSSRSGRQTLVARLAERRIDLLAPLVRRRPDLVGRSVGSPRPTRG